ncbi:5'-nucleotidase C-terminal domain-containing protein [Peribacillus psychrosaccharolyticus]|uniref:5'-nucleotidase C-terminal domain-containing protein n=1 Tax=Peribacillus psychrosaccharolyticus TaxID=1407 RepID=A0A974RZ92_PERPY|nr:5'-nucleotidase C-terminal domain-containing protein [Peribacillus psychrosaccharolyticus]MEC2055428.1 5'-nucleotidase C-terminal domain-containing protein [Peribacillus psychrosaccharolyticus]MED3743542.1 5'-nucleotidase C-terminal domain-containing protein [Peribacillus psychrosaccharolyticus]QQS99112.1 5'-nucleotidase C-terminal domain-containing protein [Peribacillus psychrosaccharolyticus]
MSKKKAIKFATASAIAVSAIAAAAPTQAATNSVDQSISSAITKMKTAFHTYKQPAEKGQLPSLSKTRSAVKDAQKAYQSAVDAINKKGGSKTKKASYMKKLTNKKYYLERAEKYVLATNINLKKAQADLDTAITSGKQKNVLKAQTALHTKIAAFEKATAKVYGPKVRAVLDKTYTVPAKAKAASVNDEMAVYQAYKEIESGKLIETDLEKAGKIITNTEKYVTAISAKQTKLAANLLAVVKKNKELYEKATAPKHNPLKLTLLHTNDTHAHLDNVAKRATVVKEERTANPHTLLLDAGDVFSGTLYFNKFEGQADVEFMNAMSYDLMTFGNHEFDLGSSPQGHAALASFIKAAKFPMISSNVDFSKDANLSPLYSDTLTMKPENGKIYSEVVLNVEGENVGFIGLTTEETKDISSPGSVAFENYIEAAKKSVAALEKQGVNKIVALNHLGFDDNPAYDNDQILAAAVSGIDVIIGGHSHTQLDKPVVIAKDNNGKEKDPTVIVQAYQYGDFVGKLNVNFDAEGKILEHEGNLIKTSDKADDPEVAKSLEKYSSVIKELKAESTGATAVKALTNPRTGGNNALPSVRKNETELGNLITDGMLDKAKEYNPETVIAFQNGGGIREAINEGDITVGEVLTTLPFGNTLATMKLSGAEIKEALEHSVSLEPLENGGFLHVSGMKFTYDSTKPAGSRVQKMEVVGKNQTFSELIPTAEYVVATNAFTAKGGDGFDVFKKAYEAGRVTDLGLSDWENLRDYAAKLKTVEPKIEGRIVDISETVTK